MAGHSLYSPLCEPNHNNNGDNNNNNNTTGNLSSAYPAAETAESYQHVSFIFSHLLYAEIQVNDPHGRVPQTFLRNLYVFVLFTFSPSGTRGN